MPHHQNHPGERPRYRTERSNQVSSEALGFIFKKSEDLDDKAYRLLSALANSANVHQGFEDAGHITWMGNALLSRKMRCTERTVSRTRTWAVEHGYIREAPDQGVVMDNSKYPANRSPIVYEIALSDEMRARWAAEQAGSTRRESAAEGGRKSPGMTRASTQVTSDNTTGLTPVSTHEEGARVDTGDAAGLTPVSTKPTSRTNKGSASDDSLRSSSARPAETQQPLIDTPPAVPTPTQRAETVAREWVKRRRDQGIPVPNAKQVHMGVRGYAKAAFEEGVTDAQVKTALDRAGETLPSMPVWRRALEEVVTGRTQVRPWQRGQVPYRDKPGTHDVDVDELFGTGGTR